MRYLLFALIGLALIGGPGPSRAAELGYKFESRDWAGTAYSDDSTGAFSHCAISAGYNSGITLAFGLTADYELSLALFNPDWSLPQDGSFSVRLGVDGRSLGRFEANAVNEQAVRIAVGNDGAAFTRFRKGRLLTVAAAREEFEFDLTGTYAALAKLRDCVGIVGAFAGDSTNPFGSSGKDAKAARKRAGDDDAAYIQPLLRAAGLDDFSLLTAAELSAYPELDVAWRGDGYFGFMIVVRVDGGSARETMNRTLAEIGGDCDGEYATGIKNRDRVGAYVLIEAFSTCRQAGAAITYSVLGIFEGDTAVYVGHIAGESGRARIFETTANLKLVLAGVLGD